MICVLWGLFLFFLVGGGGFCAYSLMFNKILTENLTSGSASSPVGQLSFRPALF